MGHSLLLGHFESINNLVTESQMVEASWFMTRVLKAFLNLLSSLNCNQFFLVDLKFVNVKINKINQQYANIRINLNWVRALSIL